MRILLVEDEKPLSAAIVKMLEQEHFALDAAYTGPDGLDCVLSGIYDAIVLDVMLPGMDGFAVLRALRQQGVSTPVLMLTARGGVQDRGQGLDLGADYVPAQALGTQRAGGVLSRRCGSLPWAMCGSIPRTLCFPARITAKACAWRPRNIN